MLQESQVPFPNNGYQLAGKITQNRLKRYTGYRSDPTWILSTPVSNKLTAVWYVEVDLTDLTQEEEGYSIQVDGVEAEVRSRLRSENFKGELDC